MACDDEELPAEPDNSGILIVNEGNFGDANGSLSLYNNNSDSLRNNVFQQANNQRELGATLQSVYTDGNGRAYLVCNSADKIEVINLATFEAGRAPIQDPDLVSPRYMAVSGNKAFVSVWGPFNEDFQLTNSKVAVVDLEDGVVDQYIPVPIGPEDVLLYNNKVYVANSFTDTVTVIDAITEAILTRIPTNASPTRMALDANNNIWVSTTGGLGGIPQFQRINPETDTVEASVSLEGTGANGKFAMNPTLDSLYYIGTDPFPATSTRIYRQAITATSAPDFPFVSGEGFYGLGFDPAENILYVGDSRSFQQEGLVFRYALNGTQLDQLGPVGLGPNAFIFPG